MTACFVYPQAAFVGRAVPKTRIFEHANAKAALKDRFAAGVERIAWSHKLAPETINLDSTATVPEIQVFSLALKTGTLDERVLRALDAAIPFPLIFELTHAGRRRAAAAPKRPPGAGGVHWSAGDYLYADWEAESAPRQPLPLALDLGGLYEALLSALLPEAARGEPDFATRLARADAIHAKQREIARLKSRMNREKQFNKRAEINVDLRAAKRALAELTDPGEGKG